MSLAGERTSGGIMTLDEFHKAWDEVNAKHRVNYKEEQRILAMKNQIDKREYQVQVREQALKADEDKRKQEWLILHAERDKLNLEKKKLRLQREHSAAEVTHHKDEQQELESFKEFLAQDKDAIDQARDVLLLAKKELDENKILVNSDRKILRRERELLTKERQEYLDTGKLARKIRKEYDQFLSDKMDYDEERRAFDRLKSIMSKEKGQIAAERETGILDRARLKKERGELLKLKRTVESDLTARQRRARDYESLREDLDRERVKLLRRKAEFEKDSQSLKILDTDLGSRQKLLDEREKEFELARRQMIRWRAERREEYSDSPVYSSTALREKRRELQMATNDAMEERAALHRLQNEYKVKISQVASRGADYDERDGSLDRQRKRVELERLELEKLRLELDVDARNHNVPVRTDISREKVELEKTRRAWDDLNARYDEQRRQLKLEYESKWAREERKWGKKHRELDNKSKELISQQSQLDEERLRLLQREREQKELERTLKVKAGNMERIMHDFDSENRELA